MAHPRSRATLLASTVPPTASNMKPDWHQTHQDTVAQKRRWPQTTARPYDERVKDKGRKVAQRRAPQGSRDPTALVQRSEVLLRIVHPQVLLRWHLCVGGTGSVVRMNNKE
jgi:hypothetical protein